MTDEVLFREEQRFRQWWIAVLVVTTALIGWAAFLQQIVGGGEFGSRPAPDVVVWAVWVVTGLGLPAAWRWVRLVTVVRPGRVVLRFPPFPARTIGTDEILDVQPVTYRALADWGGYGYRMSLGGDVAFIVRGDRGVRLALGGEDRVLVGSQRPEQLATAVKVARRGS